MDPLVEKYNKILEKTDDEFDLLGGYESIISGLVIQVSDIYGENTARNLCYQIGSKPGEKIARKILEYQNGVVFNDPTEAFVNLLGRLKAYYHPVIESITTTPEGILKLKFTNSCYLDAVFSRRTEFSKGGSLCRIVKGYFETALKILTGKKVILDYLDTKNEPCKMEISFS
jgi:hypothetical protein